MSMWKIKPKSLFLNALLIIALLLQSGCSNTEQTYETHKTPENLAAYIVDALKDNDIDKFMSLLITKDEFIELWTKILEYQVKENNKDKAEANQEIFEPVKIRAKVEKNYAGFIQSYELEIKESFSNLREDAISYGIDWDNVTITEVFLNKTTDYSVDVVRINVTVATNNNSYTFMLADNTMAPRGLVIMNKLTPINLR